MLDCQEIVRIKFGKKRIGNSQSRIVDAQPRFQSEPSAIYTFETFHDCRLARVVATQIRQSLLALKYGSRSNPFLARPVGRQISPITAARESDLRSTNGVTARLGPK